MITKSGNKIMNKLIYLFVFSVVLLASCEEPKKRHPPVSEGNCFMNYSEYCSGGRQETESFSEDSSSSEDSESSSDSTGSEEDLPKKSH